MELQGQGFKLRGWKADNVVSLQKHADNPNVYSFLMDLWGKAVMSNGIKLITSCAFANLDLIRIQAGVLSNNPRSMRVLEKAGFAREGVLKNNITKNNVILDEHIYAALKS